MDKTRVALTAIICITIVLTSFSLGMAPNVGTNANTGLLKCLDCEEKTT